MSDKPVFKLEDTIEGSTSKIDIIKNLIFGETMAAYNAEFEELKNDILLKKNILENLIDEVKLDLNKAIDNLSTDLNIRITDLESSIEDKVDALDKKTVSKETLGKLLVELGEKINAK